MIKTNISINKQEERKLLLDYKLHNNIEARNRLVQAHQKFIYNESLKYYKVYTAQTNGSTIYELDDFISEANRALIRAIDAFDIKKSTRLLTYAGYWIKAYLVKIITNNDEYLEGGGIDVDMIEPESKETQVSMDPLTLSMKLEECKKLLSPLEFFVITTFFGMTGIPPNSLSKYLCRKQQCIYYIKRKAKQKLLAIFTPAEISTLLSLY